MKKTYFMLIVLTVALNMYLIFGWNPYVEENNIAVASYEDKDDYNKINISYNADNNQQYDKDGLRVQSLYVSDDKNIESLSDKDIEELDKILNKLAISDLEKWIELKNNGSNDNIIEFFKIIHKRMSKDDYEKVTGIIGEIIDIDRVEGVLKNNYV
ncbi:hypothetical protein [uncultured Clostridium sp.]|uniref:hypothetical protein n=1 Tax=uncultured Clostridium sp. TaxID=59620 RepID=UPI0025FD08B7|nr:hypothetical protein [uncultured Clostridium sp.]